MKCEITLIKNVSKKIQRWTKVKTMFNCKLQDHKNRKGRTESLGIHIFRAGITLKRQRGWYRSENRLR